jgi:hypothetical protein
MFFKKNKLNSLHRPDLEKLILEGRPINENYTLKRNEFEIAQTEKLKFDVIINDVFHKYFSVKEVNEFLKFLEETDTADILTKKDISNIYKIYNKTGFDFVCILKFLDYNKRFFIDYQEYLKNLTIKSDIDNKKKVNKRVNK